MKLKEGQIEFIEEDLRERGITYHPLHEDLVDHICCELEEAMSKGYSFMDAYNLVIKAYEKRGISDLNRETIDILSNLTMIKDFLKTSIRLFRKNSFSSTVRVLGLAIGITVFMVSVLFMTYEYSYDSFYQDAESIYRIGRITEQNKITTTTFPLVPNLKNDFPDYTFTRFFKSRANILFRLGDKRFYEEKMIMADEDFLTIFNFDGFIGNPQDALKNPFSVVLTQETSIKYFERVPELGETIEFKWNGEYYNLNISGIIPEWPENSHLDFDILVSFKSAESIFPGGIIDSWNMNYCYSYVKLPNNVDRKQFENQFEGFINLHVADNDIDYQSYLGFLQQLSDIHIQPQILSNYTKVIDPNYLKMALAIGIVVLLITSVNFITITVAQYQTRSKEMGVRKAIGATRKQVILQLTIETFFLVMLSFLSSLVLMYISIDVLNQFMSIELSLSMLFIGWVIYFIPLLILLITLITGLYPAIFFSAKNIMETITPKKSNELPLRKVLLITQFMIAAILIIFTIVIYGQVGYMQNKAIGFNKDQIVYIPHGRHIRFQPDAFKTAAMQHPAVERVSLSFYKPSDTWGNLLVYNLQGKDPVTIATTSVDEDFFETFEIALLEGRNFSKEGMARNKVFIINESAVKLLELENPIGTVFKTTFQTGNPDLPSETREGQIIGVVKDVHFESLHATIKPMVFMIKPYWYYYINVRINTQNMTAGLNHLESTWNKMFPDEPFEYVFLSTDFEKLYETEARLAKALLGLVVLAIATACFGLFGYSHFLAHLKTKEICIRKILGANLLQITSVFSREFLVSILIANLIAWPFTYFLSTKWLETFSYRIDITFFPFYITLFFLLITTALTILWELIQVMKIDPSKTLRYE